MPVVTPFQEDRKSSAQEACSMGADMLQSRWSPLSRWNFWLHVQRSGGGGGWSPRITEEEKHPTALAWQQVARAGGRKQTPHPKASCHHCLGLCWEGHGAAEGRPYTGRVTTQVTQRREGKTEENSSPGRLENALDTFSMTAGWLSFNTYTHLQKHIHF